MTPILSPKWQGQRAAYIDPASIRFKAIESPSMDPDDVCRGCLFATQVHAVCDTANKLAVAAGQPDCGDVSPQMRDYIYVLDDSDPRQLDMLKEVTP